MPNENEIKYLTVCISIFFETMKQYKNPNMIKKLETSRKQTKLTTDYTIDSMDHIRMHNMASKFSKIEFNTIHIS